MLFTIGHIVMRRVAQMSFATYFTSIEINMQTMLYLLNACDVAVAYKIISTLIFLMRITQSSYNFFLNLSIPNAEIQ